DRRGLQRCQGEGQRPCRNRNAETDRRPRAPRRHEIAVLTLPKSRCALNSLSAPGGGEGWGEVGDSRVRDNTHLTLPRLRRGPLPLPPEGRRGNSPSLPQTCPNSTR